MAYAYVDIIKEKICFNWTSPMLPYVVYRDDICNPRTSLGVVIDITHIAAFVHELDARKYCDNMNGTRTKINIINPR